MQTNSTGPETSTIVWSLLWAFAIIAAAFLFKGSPFYNWIEAGLTIGALTFVILKRPHPVRTRR